MATEDLEELIGLLAGDIAGLTHQLQFGDITPIIWQDGFESLLAKYHVAAAKTALKVGSLNETQLTEIARLLGIQMRYARRFRREIEDSLEWENRWMSRSVMYAESIKLPYWKAFTGFAKMPGWPGEGTACLTNCRCSWDELGPGHFAWVRHVDDSCSTCLERGVKWADVFVIPE